MLFFFIVTGRALGIDTLQFDMVWDVIGVIGVRVSRDMCDSNRSRCLDAFLWIPYRCAAYNEPRRLCLLPWGGQPRKAFPPPDLRRDWVRRAHSRTIRLSIRLPIRLLPSPAFSRPRVKILFSKTFPIGSFLFYISLVLRRYRLVTRGVQSLRNPRPLGQLCHIKSALRFHQPAQPLLTIETTRDLGGTFRRRK